MAVIVFEQVYAPLCILLGIYLLFSKRTEGASASAIGSIGINTKFQSLAVGIVHRGLHAYGELGRIFLRTAIGMAILSVPEVVDDEVVVASIFQTLFHHGIRHLLHYIGGNFILYHVPRNPSHHGLCHGEVLLNSEGSLCSGRLSFAFLHHNRVFINTISFRRNTFYSATLGIPSQTIGEIGHRYIEGGICSYNLVQHAVTRKCKDIHSASEWRL